MSARYFESRIAELENENLLLKQEWERLYPYTVLETSLAVIAELVNMVYDLDPNNERAGVVLKRAEEAITKALEPEVFHLK